jgi:hypothetical protein
LPDAQHKRWSEGYLIDGALEADRDDTNSPGVWFVFSDEIVSGQKDDAGKLRTDLIPARSLFLLTEHAEEILPIAPSRTSVLKGLAFYRETGELTPLLDAAVHLAGLLGTGTWITEVARVLQYGAFEAPRPDGSKGYGEDNWQGVENALDRYYAATLRHLAAGAGVDEQSGLSHLAHALTCVLFLIWFESEGVDLLESEEEEEEEEAEGEFDA